VSIRGAKTSDTDGIVVGTPEQERFAASVTLGKRSVAAAIQPQGSRQGTEKGVAASALGQRRANEKPTRE